MKKTVFFLAALVTTAPSVLGAQAVDTNPVKAAPTLIGMKAYLFRNKSATWSDNILDPAYGGSWNSIAGPNAANATLVVVEVSGPPGATYTGYFGNRTKYSVRLVASEMGRKTKRLLDQTQPIPVLSDQGKVHLGFLLYQGGCATVRLTATVIGPGSAKALDESLHFACGE